MKIFIIIFFILILFYILFFIKKNYIETFSKNETVKLINEISENYILPTYISNLQIIANNNRENRKNIVQNNIIKEDLPSSKYNLSDVINSYESSKGILTPQYNINKNNNGSSKSINGSVVRSSSKSLSDILNINHKNNSNNVSSNNNVGSNKVSDSSKKNEYKSKDGINLLSLLGNTFKKLIDSNIGKLFLKFLSMITKADILKVMAKSAECSVESKLVGLEKGTCLIGEDRTCFWNRQILEANNNVRCQCGSDNSSMSWYNSLAEHEANYAKELATKNKCKIQSGFNGHNTTFTDPKTKKTYKFSENIAISGKYSSSASDRLKAGESAVNGWSSEGIGKYATKNDSSNYTAMNWNTNTLVGCGSEYCSDSENYITICAYTNEEGNPGNTYSGLSKSDKNKKISENVNCENPIFLGL